MRPRSRCSDRVLRFVLPTVLVAFALVLPGCGGETSGAPPPPVEEVARQLVLDGAKSAIVFIAEEVVSTWLRQGIADPARISGFGSGV